jgi:hypothetical protein
VTTYQKIPGPFRREDTKPHRIIDGAWTSEELAFLSEVDWTWTEKVDGTNIRIIWDGHRVTYGGRTDNAQIPAKLVTALDELFKGEAVEQVFELTWGESPAVLYGEGYGAGIQKGGGNYRQTQGFVLFDVKVGDWWLKRPDVEDVARNFDLDVVPVVFIGSLREAIDYVKVGFDSTWGDFSAEGLVGRPFVDLFDRRGHRIIVKVKTADFR